MPLSIKTIAIGIGSYICFILSFYLIYKHQGVRWATFEEYQYPIIILSCLWLLLPFVREPKDNPTRSLKTILLLIAIYLLLLIFIKPTFNFTHREFVCFYLLWIATLHSAMSLSPQRKKIWTLLGASLIILMLVHQFLFVYRKVPDFSHWYEQTPYLLHIPPLEKDQFYSDNLSLSSAQSNKIIPLQGAATHILHKGQDYHLQYHSHSPDPAHSLLVQAPSGFILQIFPQTILTINTSDITPTRTLQRGKVLSISIEETSSDPFLHNLQSSYHQQQQYFILSSLPTLFQTSSKLQYLSYHYSLWISQHIPFYHSYQLPLQHYRPYLNISTFPSTLKGESNRSMLKKHQKIWREKTNTLHSLRSSFSTRF